MSPASRPSPLDAGEPRAQLVGAARHLGVAIARLARPRARPARWRLRARSARARRLARILGLAPRGLGDARSCCARLLDAGLLGVARAASQRVSVVDRGLRRGLLGDRPLDLLADLGQAVCAG
jgi:hypothetical protein